MSVATEPPVEGPPESRTEPRDGDGYSPPDTGTTPDTGRQEPAPVPNPGDPFGYHDGGHDAPPTNGSTPPPPDSSTPPKSSPTQTLGDLLSSLFGGGPQKPDTGGGTVATQIGGKSKVLPVMLLLIGTGFIGYYVYEKYYAKKGGATAQ